MASRIMYWCVVAGLAALALVCLFVVATKGWSLAGALGLVGALVSAALLFSYAGSARDGRRPVAR